MGFSELFQRFKGSQGKPRDMKTQRDVRDATECSITSKLDFWQESGMKGTRAILAVYENRESGQS